MKKLTQLIVPLLLGALAACGGNPDAGPVTVSPKTASVKAGDKANFTATVEGAKESKVLWSVEGGDAHGTITSTGVYTAPTEAGSYTVVATNAVDTSKKDTATVTVLPAVVVVIEPAATTVATAGTATFKAKVTGAEDTSVTWSIQEGESGGSITPAGVYTAPTTAGTYTVVATSVADPSRKGTTRVKVEPVAVSVKPASSTVDQRAVVELSAEVSGTPNAAVTWSVEGGNANGTITASGVYTAPEREGTYTVIATSVADPTKKGTATLTVRAVAVSISAPATSVPTAGSLAFSATVTGTTGSTAVTWSVEGGSANGTITASGVYTAPTTAGTYTVVATSVADTSRKATAQVTVVPVNVRVYAAAAELDQGATTSLSAEISGTSNTAVTWSVEGGANNGTIDDSGIYIAPARAGTYTVVATSVADKTKKGSATITVRDILVALTPDGASVHTAGNVAFYATVTGTIGTKAVTWSVEGGSANGTITASGVYTAPTKAGTYTVVATSVADTSKKGTTQVTVVPVNVSIAPETPELDQGDVLTFTADVTGSPLTAVTWSVEGGSANGIITSTGVYTAPFRAGTYTVVATSVVDSSKKATATVTVRAVQVSIDPATVTLDQGAPGSFTATVTGTTGSRSVTWSVEGGDANGTITRSGDYTAPTQAGTYTVVATSVADSTKKATATVTVRQVEVKLTPATVTLRQGASATFAATVLGTTVSTAVTWSAQGGSVDDSGHYTAPAEPGTYSVTVTSVADSSRKATATITVPVASGLDYVNPTSTGWRLVKNTSESTANHLVLDLVGPEGQSGRGVDLTLSADATRASWTKVSGADAEHVTNRAFSLGSAPQLLKGTVKDNALLVGVFQKGTTSPAVPLDGALLSVALELKPAPTLPAGAALPLSVLKAHALPGDGLLGQIDVAVGSLSAE